MITETQDTLNAQQEVSPLSVLHENAKDNVTQMDGRQTEVHMPTSLYTLTDSIYKYIGSWNERSMYIKRNNSPDRKGDTDWILFG